MHLTCTKHVLVKKIWSWNMDTAFIMEGFHVLIFYCGFQKFNATRDDIVDSPLRSRSL